MQSPFEGLWSIVTKWEIDCVTLGIRWKVATKKAQTFLPGIVFCGNPSGEKNRARRVPVYHGDSGEKAIFEEHRYPMPFSSLEWNNNNNYKCATLHTIPSLGFRVNHEGQC